MCAESQESPIPKSENNLVDELHRLMESFNNRFTLRNPNFAERYIKMELHVGLHFRFRDGEDYIAYFQNADGIDFNPQSTEVRGGLTAQRDGNSRTAGHRVTTDVPVLQFRPSLTWRHAMCAKSRSDSKQKAVLVDVVKAVKTPESVIPSFVWFERVDSLNVIIAHSLYFSCVLGRCIFPGSISNRKTDVVTGRLPGFLSNESVDKMVERTPKVLEGIAANGDNILRDGLHADEVIAALASVRIVLDFNCIWAGTEEGITSDLQILDVLVGPINFCEE